MVINTTKKLKDLRELFNSKYTSKPLDAYIVYSNDAHMTEDAPIGDRRRKFISGFGGSAGTAVITLNRALVWTDGRYFLEAAASIDQNWTLMKDGWGNTPTVNEWLESLPPGSIVGTDPKFLSFNDWKELNKVLRKSEKKLLPVKENLIDIVWNKHGKPDVVYSTPYVHELKYTGITWQEKVFKTRQAMLENKADILVLSTLDDIAWLFNLRGSDAECSPLFTAYGILTLKEIYLFLPNQRVTESVAEHLQLKSVNSEYSITIMPYASVDITVKELSLHAKRVWFDPNTPASIGLVVSKQKYFIARNPVTIMKAAKNDVELANIKNANIRDAACLCQYFGILQSNISSTVIDEISGAEILRSIRAKMEGYVMNSFTTISSVGSNGAIIHYQTNPDTNKVITTKEIYLCDSGAQYLDGTTDITRTLHFGTPTEYEKECYTLVLKGHIDISKVIFPEGCKGSRIDAIARAPLWSKGLDYLHGTGHGIGFFLNCHEGPHRISTNSTDFKFQAGNVLSDEPGYYEDGKFGIRLENTMIVKNVTTQHSFKDLKFLGFEMISFIPYHLKLINVSMLTREEVDWLNDFNQTCIDLVKPAIIHFGFAEGLKYFEENTKPIYFIN